jgi:hypothetical protein
MSDTANNSFSVDSLLSNIHIPNINRNTQNVFQNKMEDIVDFT